MKAIRIETPGGPQVIAAHNVEHPREHIAESTGAGMRAAQPLLSAIDHGDRTFDIAEHPGRNRQIVHGGDAHIIYKAISEIVVATRFEQGERLVEMIARFDELAGELMVNSDHAMGHARLGRVRPPLDFLAEDLDEK